MRFFASSFPQGRKGIARHLTWTNSLDAKRPLLNKVLNGDYHHHHGNYNNGGEARVCGAFRTEPVVHMFSAK